MRFQNRARIACKRRMRFFPGKYAGVSFLVAIFGIPLAIFPDLNDSAMDLTFSTPLKGNLVLCGDYRDAQLLRRPNLYKFVWVRQGRLSLEVDHIPLELQAGELVPLTPLHSLEVTAVDGEYLMLAFDSNFYCIFGHDGEVSCSGLLFNGTSGVLRLALSEACTVALQRVVDELLAEYEVADGLREEMLRMQLKRFIIICTRIARERFSIGADREKLFDTVRRYYVLVDAHFRTKKRVQEYAELLHRSPQDARQPVRILRAALAFEHHPRPGQCRGAAPAALHGQERQGDCLPAGVRGYGGFQPVFCENERREHHGVPPARKTGIISIFSGTPAIACPARNPDLCIIELNV